MPTATPVEDGWLGTADVDRETCLREPAVGARRSCVPRHSTRWWKAMMYDHDTPGDERRIEVVTRSFSPAMRSAAQRHEFAAALERRRDSWSFGWHPIPALAASAAAVLGVWLAVGSPGSSPDNVTETTAARGDVLLAVALDEGIESAGEDLPDDFAGLADVIGY